MKHHLGSRKFEKKTKSVKSGPIPIATMTKACQKQKPSDRTARFSCPCISPWAYTRVSVYTGRKNPLGNHGLIHGWDYRRVGLLTEFHGIWISRCQRSGFGAFTRVGSKRFWRLHVSRHPHALYAAYSQCVEEICKCFFLVKLHAFKLSSIYFLSFCWCLLAGRQGQSFVW